MFDDKIKLVWKEIVKLKPLLRNGGWWAQEQKRGLRLAYHEDPFGSVKKMEMMLDALVSDLRKAANNHVDLLWMWQNQSFLELWEKMKTQGDQDASMTRLMQAASVSQLGEYLSGNVREGDAWRVELLWEMTTKKALLAEGELNVGGDERRRRRVHEVMSRSRESRSEIVSLAMISTWGMAFLKDISRSRKMLVDSIDGKQKLIGKDHPRIWVARRRKVWQDE